MDSALQISVVWACVVAIAQSLASCPWLVKAVNERGEKITRWNDPLAYLLNVRPNPDMTAIGFREAIMFAALTYGNGYAEIVRDGAGRIVELWPMMPDRTTPYRLGAEDDYRLVYEYCNPGTGKSVLLDPVDVFHVHGPGVSGLMGDNVIARAAKAMGVAAAQERFAGTYFGNNAVLGGWIEYPKVLNDESHDRMKRSFEDTHKGPDKAHKIAILENGATWHPVETNAQDSQMVESRKFQILEICRYYGVPPHKIMDLDRGTFSNIEHQSIEWVRDGLTPWARRQEQEADYKLFPARSMARTTELDTAWLSYGDAKSRGEFYTAMRNIGVYSANEIRAKERENSLGPDGDIRIVPMNFQTVEQLRLAEEKAELELLQMGEPEEGDTTEGQEENAGSPEENEPAPAGHLRRVVRARAIQRKAAA